MFRHDDIFLIVALIKYFFKKKLTHSNYFSIFLIIKESSGYYAFIRI